MSRYRNLYKCPICEITWSEIMSNTTNCLEQCPVCRIGSVTPAEIVKLPDNVGLSRRGVQIEEARNPMCLCGATSGEKACTCEEEVS